MILREGAWIALSQMKYRRILLKLSGEALGEGISENVAVVIAAGQQGFDSALQVTGWLQPRAAVGLAVFRLLLRAHPQYVNLFGGAGYEGHVLVFIHAEVDKQPP